MYDTSPHDTCVTPMSLTTACITLPTAIRLGSRFGRMLGGNAHSNAKRTFGCAWLGITG